MVAEKFDFKVATERLILRLDQFLRQLPRESFQISARYDQAAFTTVALQNMWRDRDWIKIRLEDLPLSSVKDIPSAYLLGLARAMAASARKERFLFWSW